MSQLPGQRRPTDGHPPRSSSSTRIPGAAGNQQSPALSARPQNAITEPKPQSRIPNGNALAPGARNLNMKYARQQTAIPRVVPASGANELSTSSGIAVVPISDGRRGAAPATSYIPARLDSARGFDPPKVLRRKPSVIGTYMSNRQAKQKLEGGADVEPAIDSLIIPEVPASEATNRSAPDLSILTTKSPSGTESTSTPDLPYILPRTPSTGPSSQVPSLQHTDSPSAISSIATPTTQSSTSPALARSPPSFGWNRGPSPTMVRGRPDLKVVSQTAHYPGAEVEAHRHPFFQQTISKRSAAQESNSGNTTNSVTPSLTRSKSRSKLSKPRPVDKSEKPPPLPPKDTVSSKAFHPPELAHLKDPNPATAKQDVPPPRPSRDGTPTLAKQQGTFPVVYSNLTTSPQKSTTTLYSHDNGSNHSPQSPERKSPHKGISRAEPPRVQEAFSSFGETPTVARSAKSPSRFGFFRRNKAGAASDDESKQSKKGPVAGTGHEGYRKHTARKRSVSLNSAGSSNSNTNNSTAKAPTPTRRNSNESASTDSGMDEFLSRRLQPVYMRGDGAASDSQIQSSVTASIPRNPQQGNVSHQPNLSTESSKISVSSSEPPGLSHSRTSSGSEAFSGRPTDHSTAEASHRRTQAKTAGSPLAQTQSADWDSDTSISSLVNNGQKVHVQKTGWFGLGRPFARSKSPKKGDDIYLDPIPSSHASDAGDSSTEQGSVTAQTRGIAHYALLEATDQSPSLQEIESYLQEVQLNDNTTVRLAEPISLTSSSVFSNNFSYQSDDINGARLLQSTPASSDSNLQILPSTSHTSLESSGNLNASEANTARPAVTPIQPIRQYRLPQVGRIPRVISTQDTARRHDQSFSRPFGVSQPRPSTPSSAQGSYRTQENADEGGAAEVDSSALTANSQELASINFLDFADTIETPTESKEPQPKFLQFENRKNSDASYSSSSGASYFPSLIPAARIPRPESPLSEDEVWGEYDDLLDGIFSSDSWKHASGKRLELINGINQEVKPDNGTAEDLTTRRPTLRSIIKGGLKSPTAPSSGHFRFSGSNPSSERQSQASSKGRRVTFDDTDLVSIRSSESSLIRDSKILKHNASSTSDLSGEYHIRQPAKRIVDVQESADLRFGSLMTSKFMSFGRAFFSPLGEEIQTGQGHHRVLIIDGLGKDWSYYIALTYANTMVYNLGPGSANSNKRATLSNWQNLENHRHFNFSDFRSNFPFPKAFFSVVVLRFPPITVDDTLKNIISECRRVLAPGGFLEVAGLDLDLNNMGTITRKAVRDLKIKLKQDNPDLSLNPLSDSITCLLGRPGFTNLNQCMLGVPAAGVIASRENSPGSIDKGNVTRFITDQSENGDRKLTNMVSTCGRWWHQLMYEIHLLPEKNLLESFWNDTTILRECERQSTMLKMLICYAQKPLHTKRRTVSL